MSGIQQGLHRLQLPDLLRLRRCHHDPVAPAGILHAADALSLQHFRLFPAQEAADRLGGILKCRVLRIHLDLGEYRRHLFIHAAAQQFILDGILQVDPDIPLAHRDAYRQRHPLIVRRRRRQRIHCLLDQADLRTVPVGHDDFVSLRDQVHNGAGSGSCRRLLLLNIVAQRVAAQCDHIPLLSAHNFFLSSARGHS